MLVFLLIVLLCSCTIWAAMVYGTGKVRLWYKYHFSHSNIRVPVLYVPQEKREELRDQLRGTKASREVAVSIEEGSTHNSKFTSFSLHAVRPTVKKGAEGSRANADEKASELDELEDVQPDVQDPKEIGEAMAAQLA